MKKIITVFLSILVFATISTAQTVDEIITKFITASGGQQKLDSITTIQYSQSMSISTPYGDVDVPIEIYIEKNKLVRTESDMAMLGKSFTIITANSGAYYIPPNPFMGDENAGLKTMDTATVNASSHLLQTEGFFPELINYKQKGYKIELTGSEKINKKDCHKLLVTLKGNNSVTYFIDKNTGLIARKTVKGKLAMIANGMSSMANEMGNDKRADKIEVTTDYKEYQEVEGIKVPLKSTTKTLMGKAETSFTNIKFNEPIPLSKYVAE